MEAIIAMLWSLIAQVVQVVLDVLSLGLVTDSNKDLELLVLRQQIRVLERRIGKPVRQSGVEKLMLALTALQIRNEAGQKGFKNSLLLFKPAKVLKWHRELVKRKWILQQRTNKVGRPRLDEELEALIVRLAKENP